MSDYNNEVSRRKLLKMMAAASVCSVAGNSVSFSATASSTEADKWNKGNLAHLIPLVNHEQMLIKTSFTSSLKVKPYLMVNDLKVEGEMTDTQGRFWQFYAKNLNADTTYSLQLITKKGKSLTDTWPLKTFPDPEAKPTHLRILAFTCAGGNENVVEVDGTRHFLEMAARHKLIDRGMSFNPDVVISNGDHIYWDQETMDYRSPKFQKPWRKIFEEYGSLDPNSPILGSMNEPILKRIADAQISYLYGVRFRSVPVFMLTDDHDLFENDEAHEGHISLPPKKDKLAAARATQNLYYPEFLPEVTRPADLSGSSSADRASGISEVYGTLRYGKLLEALLYDTKRYSTINGSKAFVIPNDTEQWLRKRTLTEDTDHLIHIPSTPIGWSAGKWGEWYPDIRQEDGTLGQEKQKPFWPSGWWEQHQRIIEMLASQKKRKPVIASGDLHAFSFGKITKSGNLDLTANPVHSLCVGTLGSSGPAFPSELRGIGAEIPSDLNVEEGFKPLEKNGFTIIDVTPEKLVFKMYAWRPPEAIEKIDELKPFFTYEILT